MMTSGDPQERKAAEPEPYIPPHKRQRLAPSKAEADRIADVIERLADAEAGGAAPVLEGGQADKFSVPVEEAPDDEPTQTTEEVADVVDGAEGQGTSGDMDDAMVEEAADRVDDADDVDGDVDPCDDCPDRDNCSLDEDGEGNEDD